MTMTLDKLTTKVIDGQTWYRAADVAKLYGQPSTSRVTRFVNPEDKRRVKIETRDWKRNYAEMYLSRQGVFQVALRFTCVPMHEVARALA